MNTHNITRDATLDPTIKATLLLSGARQLKNNLITDTLTAIDPHCVGSAITTEAMNDGI